MRKLLLISSIVFILTGCSIKFDNLEKIDNPNVFISAEYKWSTYESDGIILYHYLEGLGTSRLIREKLGSINDPLILDGVKMTDLRYDGNQLQSFTINGKRYTRR